MARTALCPIPCGHSGHDLYIPDTDLCGKISVLIGPTHDKPTPEGLIAITITADA